MKKIFLLLVTAFCIASVTQGQVTFNPAIFTAEDEVTLTVDVTGTPVAGLSEVYIWIWAIIQGGDRVGIVNGDWGNSNPNAKMTAAGTNKWSFKFTGTTLFGLTPGELKTFGFLVKSRDGSFQTTDYKPFPFDPLVFIPTMLRVFPAKVGQDDVVTVNFDQSLANNITEERMTPSSVTVVVFSGTTPFGSPITLPVRKMESNIWGATFIPSMSYNLPAGTRLSKFTYKFNGTIKDLTGANVNASSSEAEVSFTDLK